MGDAEYGKIYANLTEGKGKGMVKKLPSIIDLANINAYLPQIPNCFSYYDSTEGRLRIFYRTVSGFRASQGCAIKGDKDIGHKSIKGLLQWCWSKHTGETGMKCGFNLFDGTAGGPPNTKPKTLPPRKHLHL